MTQHCALVHFIIIVTKSLVQTKTRKNPKERFQDSIANICLMSFKEMKKNLQNLWLKGIAYKNQEISKQGLAFCRRLGALEACLFWQAQSYHSGGSLHSSSPHFFCCNQLLHFLVFHHCLWFPIVQACLDGSYLIFGDSSTNIQVM